MNDMDGYIDSDGGETEKGEGGIIFRGRSYVGGFGLTNPRKRAHRRPNFSNGLERILTRFRSLIRLRGGWGVEKRKCKAPTLESS